MDYFMMHTFFIIMVIFGILAGAAMIVCAIDPKQPVFRCSHYSVGVNPSQEGG
jgi:hypothetical protein